MDHMSVDVKGQRLFAQQSEDKAKTGLEHTEFGCSLGT